MSSTSLLPMAVVRYACSGTEGFMDIIERRRFIQMMGGAAAISILAEPAWAQAYPARPVRVVLPYAPAGITDVVGRLISLKLSDQLGKQFVVENVPGATGNIGTA